MPIDRTSAEREVVNGEPQIVQEDGVLGWLTRGRPATVASTAMLCVASTALVAIAVTAPGYTATSIDLNDAGVWVTGTRQALLGQINTDTRQSAMAIPDLTANSRLLELPVKSTCRRLDVTMADTRPPGSRRARRPVAS